LSADQGHGGGQCNYGICLASGAGLPTDKSAAVRYFRKCINHGDGGAEVGLAEYFLSVLNEGDGISDRYRALQNAADAGIVEAQLRFARLIGDGRLSAQYYKRAADRGSLDGQLEYAEHLLEGCGVEMNIVEAERYLISASESKDGDGGRLRYGIALFCGRLDRFDLAKALSQFSKIAEWNGLARRVLDSVSESDNLVSAVSVFEGGTFFGLLRDKSGRTPLIRMINPELSEDDISSAECLGVWMDLCRSSFRFLIDLSHRAQTVLSSLPSDLVSCTSISEMIPHVFKMYSTESALYRNVNHFLRSFPIDLVSKFEKELGGIVSYINLLQSAIEQTSLRRPLTVDCTVYRGFGSGGVCHALLYETMIGEVIVWGGFSSGSLDRATAIGSFVRSVRGILFEISLPAGAVAVSIGEFSEYEESEIVIAASTGFFVESVEWITVSNSNSNDQCDSMGEFDIPCVHLQYFASWWDFDLDRRPPRFLV
jgi:hypothetical protein